MHALAVLLASQGVQEKERWRGLFLDAFQSSSHKDVAVTRLQGELRNLTQAEQRAFGIPENATDLQLYEYLMREGAALLLLLEN